MVNVKNKLYWSIAVRFPDTFINRSFFYFLVLGFSMPPVLWVHENVCFFVRVLLRSTCTPE